MTHLCQSRCQLNSQHNSCDHRHCHSESEKQRRCTLLSIILITLFMYFVVIPRFIFPRGPWFTSNNNDKSASSNSLNSLTNESNSFSFDRCRDNAIEWDGPSSFTTEAKNFRLKIDKGNIYSRVNITTGPVTSPTLRITGEVTPLEQDSKVTKPTALSSAHDEKIDIDYLGLHIVIVEEANQFDAQVWYDDRQATDPRDGEHYRACARMFFEVILPESYAQYESITIDGPVVVIHAQNLENVKFDRLHFSSSVGSISTHGRIQADIYDAKSNTGHINADNVQVATAGKPLDIHATSVTGSVQLTAESTAVATNEEIFHKIHATTNTGQVEVTVRPAGSTIHSADSKPGDLDILTRAITGSVGTTVILASKDQTLSFKSSTITGSIRSYISDEFLGKFDVSTKWGSAHVQPVKDSKSTITYQKTNAREKVGTKTLDGSEGTQGSIELKTSTGGSTLVFIH
ncbi:hypothetical protein FBU30_002688 [Linnemannia zychae]|nr:hypothetical protein FBU30_002688 [Linnemannia zychae]